MVDGVGLGVIHSLVLGLVLGLVLFTLACYYSLVLLVVLWCCWLQRLPRGCCLMDGD
jgi:hypothetical protein